MFVFVFFFWLLGLRKNESTRCDIAGIGGERKRDENDSVFSEGANGRCRWSEEKAEESKRTAGIERNWLLWDHLGFRWDQC